LKTAILDWRNPQQLHLKEERVLYIDVVKRMSFFNKNPNYAEVLQSIFSQGTQNSGSIRKGSLLDAIWIWDLLF